MPKPLVLVNEHIKTNQQNGKKPTNDPFPRLDYIEIARMLGAELLGYELHSTFWYHWARQIQSTLKLDFVESLSVASRSSKYNIVLSVSEKVAIPLAASFYMMKREIPHIVIGHKLSSIRKQRLFSMWPLHETFTHIICVCRSQLDYTINNLGISESKADFVYDKVDHNFFRPLKVDVDDYILAVGHEQRDYKTLLQSIAGTGLKLVIVASSSWTNHQSEIEETEDVTILQHISYQELRALYAGARLVVIPLYDVDYAAGVNSVLEAMAMAKPVIISRSRGVVDYVVHNETGIYTAPGDVEELKDTVLSLWGNSRQLDRLGRNARQAVEEEMNLTTYVNRIVQIVHRALAG